MGTLLALPLDTVWRSTLRGMTTCQAQPHIEVAERKNSHFALPDRNKAMGQKDGFARLFKALQ